MAEIEPPSDDAGAGEGGGISGFLSSTRNLIGGITGLVVAVSGLLIALNKVGLIGDGDDGTTTETTSTPRLFGAMTRPVGRVYFDGDTMFVKAAKPGNPLLHLAELEDPLRDVALSARVSKVSGGEDWGFAFVCRYENAANYYLLAVLSDGRYHIAKYRRGKLSSLTGGIQANGAVADETNDVTARCVGDDPVSLSLDVNGTTVRTVKDAGGIESGNVGIRVGSSESFVTCRFENFALRYL